MVSREANSNHGRVRHADWGRHATGVEHDREKWILVFHVTNAKRLRGDHAQIKKRRAMLIQPKRVML
jgi:hypothetical protein